MKGIVEMGKFKKISTKIMCLILAGALSLELVASAGAEAGVSFETTDYESTDAVSEETESEQAEILYEIISLRDEYSKRFMLSDGNVQIARYDSAVHFLDENGEWKDIDKAYKLELAVGNGKRPVGPERHYNKITGSSLGYWWHYHDGNRKGGHIFYV